MTDKIQRNAARSGGTVNGNAVAGLLETLRCSTVRTFRLIHAIQFDSPWAPQRKDVGCA